MTLPETTEKDFEKAREDFLNEAENQTKVKSDSNKLPWQEPGVSERVIKAFNLRLQEPDFLKLKFVVEQTKVKSMHTFCAEVVKNEVEKQLKKIIKE